MLLMGNAQVWISRQWNEIKGNVKFWIVTVGLSAVITGLVTLWHKLAWWEITAAGCVFASGWAGALAAILERRKSMVAGSDATAEGAILTPLQREAFQLSRELRVWMEKLGPRPRDAAEGDWATRLTFGYANRFAERVVKLAYRFAEQNVRDFVLEGATGVISEGQVADIARRIQVLAAQMDA